jgi:hypothetical protein
MENYEELNNVVLDDIIILAKKCIYKRNVEYLNHKYSTDEKFRNKQKERQRIYYLNNRDRVLNRIKNNYNKKIRKNDNIVTINNDLNNLN